MPPKRPAKSLSNKLARKKSKLSDKEKVQNVNWDMQTRSMKVIPDLPCPLEENDSNSLNVELNQQTPKLKSELLWAALDTGDVDTVASLVCSGADLSVRRSKDHSTILHEVLRSCKIKNNAKREELVQLILDRGADLDAVDYADVTVLHMAIMQEHCSTQLVEKLLKHGARLTYHERNNDTDLLWISCYKPEFLPRIIEIQKADKQTMNRRGTIAIYNLIMREGTDMPNMKVPMLDVIKQILDLGVSVNTVDQFEERHFRNRQYQVLGRALYYQQIDVGKLLLDYGADPNQKDQSGKTLLSLAAKSKNDTQASRLLIERGANIHASNDDGTYPIHDACYHGFLKNIHLFLSLGADLNCTDSKGCTPFGCMDMLERPTNNESQCLVIKHLALNFAKGGIVSVEDLEIIYEYNWSQQHFEECGKELERMKLQKVYGNVPYFAFISRNIDSMLHLMANESLIKCFKRNIKKRTKLFPIYHHMLLHSFNIAENRYKVLQAEIMRIRRIIEDIVPDLVIEKIARYSSLEAVQFCQYDYYMNLHASLKNTTADKVKIM